MKEQLLSQLLRGDSGSYRIHELVASGGFGSVFYGRDLHTNRPVAVKVLHPHHADSPRVVNLFEHEARLLQGLTHPNIVQVLDRGRTEQDVPFIVLEWVTGWTIAQLIEQRGAFPSNETAAVACQVLEGLEAAQRRGAVHRDIKPQNIMVTADGQVKVMDFGIAKEATLAAVSGSSTPTGTPAYMAPEQFRGEPLDCRTDLYALGVTLYEMLTGRAPFEGPTMAGYMYQHLQSPPPTLTAVRADVPPGLATAVHRALEKQPSARFATPHDMQAALRPFAGAAVTRPSGAPASSALTVDASPALPETVKIAPQREAAPPPPESPPPPPVPPPRRHLWPAAVGVVGLVALVGVGYLLRSDVPWPPWRSPTATPLVTTPAVTTTSTATGGRACQDGQQEASALAQRQAWAEAITKLEPLRDQGCDVVGPLYDAYLNQGMALAQDERTDEAMGLFDKALQVKDGSEARRERELALAYREGRDALGRGAWQTAIDQLGRVHQANPGYARGNVVPNLTNAYLGIGDELLAERRRDEALAAYRRADALKPGTPEVSTRIANAEAASASFELPPTAMPGVATAPPAGPSVGAEQFVREYYIALDQRRYRDAYAFLSRAARSRQAYPDFERQFAQTLRGITVRYVDGVNVGATTASLAAHTTTVSQEGARQTTACWRVDWRLVLEDGQWRRESLSQVPEDC